MISCSMIRSLMGAVWLCSANTSQPRTESQNRTKISPLAKSKSFVGVGLMPRHAATSLGQLRESAPGDQQRLLRARRHHHLAHSILRPFGLLSGGASNSGSFRPRGFRLGDLADAARRRGRRAGPRAGPPPLDPIRPELCRLTRGRCRAPGEHVLGDHRAEPAVYAPSPRVSGATGYRVAAGERVRADRRAVLGHPVVVREDRGFAPMFECSPNVRVARVGQGAAPLAPSPTVAFFSSTWVPMCAPGPIREARAQPVHVRPDARAGADLGRSCVTLYG